MNKFFKYCILALFVFILPFCVFAKEDDEVTLYLFHGDGCPHCAAEQEFLSEIEGKYSNLKIVKYEVWYNQENAELLQKVENAFDITRGGVPTTVIGDVVIVGFGDSTSGRIERAIEFYKDNEYVDQIEKIKAGIFSKEKVKDDFKKEEEKKDDELTIKVPIFGNVNLKNVSLTTAAVIIGLIDGFNPCAMWVLLFLISVLIGMKDKKRMWALGIAFLLTSAFVYLLIMLSWITIAVKITTVIWVRNIIAVVSVGGAIVNLRAYLMSRKESGCQVVNDKKRKKIFGKIKKFTSEKSFILALLGVMGLAFSVNLVELACSAGLPLVFSELLALNNVSEFTKFMYTLLYVFFFLIDDLIVFVIAMLTMQVTGISTKYNKYSHLLGGIVMLIIGILLLFKPEWLMFQFK
jgi:thiol-disulfide isomerase/thioredoxin